MVVVWLIDPALFERVDLRAALAGHDIGAVYRALQERGVSQRQIAALTGQCHLQAGLDAFDAGLYDRALYHYQHGLELATEAGDAYCQTLALNYTGLAHVEHGHPNDALKVLQIAQVKARDIAPDEERAFGEGSRVALEACARADSATALALLGDLAAADAALAQSRELWQPTPAVPAGDLDKVSALLALDRGRLDAAEAFASGSARLWEDRGARRGRTVAGILLATIHVQAGEPDRARLAHEAITDAMTLSSVRVRRRLEPLAAALEARPSSENRDLARTARHVATTGV